MNFTSSEAATYFDALRPMVAPLTSCELFVLPPFTSIWVARDRLRDSNVAWGAQDVHAEDAGAHTGDISAPMLADLGCTFVEVGHEHGARARSSSRRHRLRARLGNRRGRRRRGPRPCRSRSSRAPRAGCASNL